MGLPSDPQALQELLEAVRLQAAHDCWRKGYLDYKRDPTQKKIQQTLKASKHETHFLLCSRRLGKTYELLLEAFELALQKPNARILYLMPFAKDAKTVVSDVLTFILADAPKDVFDLDKNWRKQDNEFIFNNGSLIRLKGTNGEHAQYLRGGHADLVILDESGLMDDLKHIFQDIVQPMTMTTDGRVIFATTPARSPGHESTLIYNDLADKGAVNIFTLRDNTRVEDWKKVKYLIAAGETEEHAWKILTQGAEPTTTTAKREYFCQFVTDADSAVFPEFDAEAKKAIIVTHERPAFFDCYTAVDPGFRDKTGILYAYWDYPNGKLVIEGESLLQRATTADIAKEIREKEQLLWKDQEPLIRVTDVDPRLMADLARDHKMAFTQAAKKDSEGGIDLVRRMISMRELVIAPTCVSLIRQLENAIYDTSGKDFDRDPVDSHFDLCAALKYLCRTVIKSRNPFPEWARRPNPKFFHSPKKLKALSTGLLGNSPTARRITDRLRKTKTSY